MNSDMKTQTLLVALMVAILFSLPHVYGQPENRTEVKYGVHIDDIDLATDTAQVNIMVTISNLNTTGIPPKEPKWAIIISEIDNVQIDCTRNIDGDLTSSESILGELESKSFPSLHTTFILFRYKSNNRCQGTQPWKE
jgi:hypothetical protein